MKTNGDVPTGEEVTPAVVKSQWDYQCAAHGLPIIQHRILPGPAMPQRMCAKCINPQHGKGAPNE